MKVLIDSGAKKSFISNKIISIYNLKMEPNTNKRVKIADGSETEIIGKINIYIKNNNNNFGTEIELNVLANLNEDIIFGTDFFRKNNINLNLNNQQIQFLGQVNSLNDTKLHVI
ncbi:hypothetical protein DMUE_0659 [Dictyocoela muelleri]|nr:hypothetical protein DMUE_0659 [Dictyocoela muelleri]